MQTGQASGWKFPKFHVTCHVPRNIMCYGSLEVPFNFFELFVAYIICLCTPKCTNVQNCSTNSGEHAHVAFIKKLAPSMNRKGDWERQILNVHRRRDGVTSATKRIAGECKYMPI